MCGRSLLKTVDVYYFFSSSATILIAAMSVAIDIVIPPVIIRACSILTNVMH